MEANFQLGYSDGLQDALDVTNAADTLEYFALKKKRDQRVSGVSFDQFRSMKQQGDFDQFDPLSDPRLQALFLQ